ncbi:hypothetical protein NSP_47290 [Nodularia spumigena CCY9414]|nr:hypothetical protein NSP_47290 [Nodularia spumigena CCY9414]
MPVLLPIINAGDGEWGLGIGDWGMWDIRLPLPPSTQHPAPLPLPPTLTSRLKLTDHFDFWL